MCRNIGAGATDEEMARELLASLDAPVNVYGMGPPCRQYSAEDHAKLTRLLAAVRSEQREADAKVAERYGCGKPGCTECGAGAAAVEIRNQGAGTGG